MMKKNVYFLSFVYKHLTYCRINHLTHYLISLPRLYLPLCIQHIASPCIVLVCMVTAFSGALLCCCRVKSHFHSVCITSVLAQASLGRADSSGRATVQEPYVGYCRVDDKRAFAIVGKSKIILHHSFFMYGSKSVAGVSTKSIVGFLAAALQYLHHLPYADCLPVL